MKNGKSVPNRSLWSTPYSTRRDERLVQEPARDHERRDVGVDVRMAPDHGDRLVEPRMAHVCDHDPQLREAQRDLVEQDRPCLEQRPGAREGRALVDQHRQLEPLERLADTQERRTERLDVLVDRPQLAAHETEVALHPLELVERGPERRVDRPEADQPSRGRARRTTRRSRSGRRSRPQEHRTRARPRGRCPSSASRSALERAAEADAIGPRACVGDEPR